MAPLITRFQHAKVDIQHAVRVAESISWAKTALGSVAAIGTGTSWLGGYAVGKVAQIFFQINPTYTAIAGALIFGTVALHELAKWSTRRFLNFIAEYQIVTRNQKKPDFIRTSLTGQPQDFLYRNLYAIYEAISVGQPVRNLADLTNRLKQAAELLDRHLPQMEGAQEVLHARAQIKDIQRQLQNDLMIYLHLTPPSQTPSFLAKRGVPLSLEAEDFSKCDNQEVRRWLCRSTYKAPVRDLLYRKLYAMYEVACRGQTASTPVEIKDRLAEAVELLKRHWSPLLIESERVIESLNEKTRSQLIEEARVELFLDISRHLHLKPAYEELVRRATDEERKDIEKILQSLPNNDPNIHELLNALKQGDWNAKIFENKNLPLYALKAVRRGLLSQKDYATLMIFWEMTQMHPDPSTRKTVPIFDHRGNVNAEAKRLIVSTLKGNKTDPDSNILTEAQIDLMFDKIRRLPKFQQQIWIVPYEGEEIEEQIPVPILSQVSTRKMMVEPLGILQAFLDTAFGENAVELNPVHGLSTWNQLKQNHIDGERDLALHSPVISLPEKADGNLARWFYFGLKHDGYHALIISLIDPLYRDIFVECYNIIQSYFKAANLDMGSVILDMEAILFLENLSSKRESPEDIFWVQLAKFIEDAAAIEVQSKVTKSGQKNILELYRKEKEHQQIYVLQIAAYLSSIPEIQKGGHGVYERIKNNNNRFLGHPISEGVLGVLKRIKMPE